MKAISKGLWSGASPIGKFSTSLDIIASGKLAAAALGLPEDNASVAKLTFKMKTALNCLVRESKTGAVKNILCAISRAHVRSRPPPVRSRPPP